MAVFAYGTLWAAPSAMLDPDTPSILAPLFVVGSAVPMLTTGLLFGGYVHQIYVVIPPSARQSKERLIRFAKNMPQSTKVELRSMWFRPWPHTTEVKFGELRRLPHSYMRLSNLERVLPGSAEMGERHRFWKWLDRAIHSRYLVSRTQLKDRSKVPGVWDAMWEQIAKPGDKIALMDKVVQREKEGIVAREPAITANRPPHAPRAVHVATKRVASRPAARKKKR